MNHNKAIQKLNDSMDYLDKLEEAQDIADALTEITSIGNLKKTTLVIIVSSLSERLHNVLRGDSGTWLNVRSVREMLENEQACVTVDDIPVSEEVSE